MAVKFDYGSLLAFHAILLQCESIKIPDIPEVKKKLGNKKSKSENILKEKQISKILFQYFYLFLISLMSHSTSFHSIHNLMAPAASVPQTRAPSLAP